jgi:hypothetical protein
MVVMELFGKFRASHYTAERAIAIRGVISRWAILPSALRVNP